MSDIPEKAFAAMFIEAYQNGGEAAGVLDGFIAKLEAKSAELSKSMNKDDILIADSVNGLLARAKVMRERCQEAAKATTEKKEEQKKYLKNANLAAIYYWESVKQMRRLAMLPVPDTAFGMPINDNYGRIYHDLVEKFIEKTADIAAKNFNKAKEAGKEMGLNVRSGSKEEGADGWEIWEREEVFAPVQIAPKKSLEEKADELAAKMVKLFNEETPDDKSGKAKPKAEIKKLKNNPIFKYLVATDERADHYLMDSSKIGEACRAIANPFLIADFNGITETQREVGKMGLVYAADKYRDNEPQEWKDFCDTVVGAGADVDAAGMNKILQSAEHLLTSTAGKDPGYRENAIIALNVLSGAGAAPTARINEILRKVGEPEITPEEDISGKSLEEKSKEIPKI